MCVCIYEALSFPFGSVKTMFCRRVKVAMLKEVLLLFVQFFILFSSKLLTPHCNSCWKRRFCVCLHYSKNIVLTFPTNFYLNGRVGNKSGMEETENFKDELP